MVSVEVEIAGRAVINAQLAQDRTALDEVIVLGYSTRGKNQITGSTVQVSGESLKQIPVMSVDQALQGKVAGLVVNTISGTPGAFQEIRIRGVSSIGASNSPLFVIDGVPVNNEELSGRDWYSSFGAMSSLSTADIESVTVLKDASATSAYGARGSNGVIVITTTKGKQGRTNFNLSASYGIQNKAVEGREVLTAAQREELWLEGIINSSAAGLHGIPAGITTPVQAWAHAVATPTTTGYGGVNGYAAWRAAGRPENDWGAAVLNKNAPIYNLNLSASGGKDGNSFYTSLSYMNNEAVVIGNLFERISGQLNLTQKLSEKVTFNTLNSVSYTNQNKIFLENSAYYANPHSLKFFMAPTQGPYNADGTYNLDLGGASYNILYLQEANESWNHVLRGTTNNSLEWEIIENLKFRTVVAMDFILGRFKDYSNKNHGDAVPEGGSSTMSVDEDFNIVYQNSLDYSYSLNDHKFDFKALIEYQQYSSWFTDGYGESFVTDGLTNIASTGANWDADGSFSDWSNLSYLGMVNYNYLGKYIADFTFRREGSSRFPAESRFGNFWAVGGAWNLSQENFMSGVSFVDNLRLRASYGISGNSGVSLNSFQALLSFSGSYAGAGTSNPSGYGNPVLTWEKNKNYDIGIDFAVLNSRIDGQISYYNKETFDLLQSVPLTLTSGFSSVNKNVGSMVNKGIEGIFNFGIVKTQDFNIDLSVNFATLNNEVTELAKDGLGNYINATSSATRAIEVGHTFMEWKVREWAGVDPATGDPLWYINRTVDETTTTNYNLATRQFVGESAIPTLTGGGGLHMDYKGVYIDVNFYYAGGHKVFEDWTFYTWDNGLYATNGGNGAALLLDRWQKPGDITNVPKIMHTTDYRLGQRSSTRQLFDGDYMRLKDLVLGFNIPASIASKAKLQGASVYVRGTNLWTYAFDAETRKGFDPETGSDGFTGLETPPIKSIIFGINVNF